MWQAIDVTAGGAFMAVAGVGKLAGASLRAAAGVDATMTIRETDGAGRILAVLSAPAKGADHFAPQEPVVYSGNVFVAIVGAGAEAIAYQG
jgi:hypothetical protein